MAKKQSTKPKGVEQAYENAPGKPIIHNGCPMCGLITSHTATCPARGETPPNPFNPLDPQTWRK